MKARKRETTEGGRVMTNYIFIESRDPFESRDTQFVEEMVTALKQRGNEVTVFLVQNGVLATRRKARDPYLARLAQAGIKLLADDFSLCERGIQSAELDPGVRTSSIDSLVDALLQENTKAIWH
jgi:predicted peroxiredoxin